MNVARREPATRMVEPAPHAIGDAARLTGLSAKMIRHYEQLGLIAPSERSASGYRYFSESDLHRLRFIRRARGLGFSMAQIASLLALWSDPQRASAEVKQVAQRHAAELRRKISEMQAMLRTLEDLAAHCQGDARPDCPILDDLAGVSCCADAPA